MSYEVAINKSWEALAETGANGLIPVKFLADEYTVDTKNQTIISLSCNVPAKDFFSILILHYLAHRTRGLPQLTGEWLSFKEVSGVEGYSSAFRKRAIEPVLRKYGSHPEGILTVLERLPAKKVDQGDMAIVLEAFVGVPVLIELWRQDDEFGAEANMLFDKSIVKIFCAEDIAVLASIIAHQI